MNGRSIGFSALHAIAQSSVEAHLLKLIAEGKVRREGGRYFLSPGPA